MPSALQNACEHLRCGCNITAHISMLTTCPLSYLRHGGRPGGMPPGSAGVEGSSGSPPGNPGGKLGAPGGKLGAPGGKLGDPPGSAGDPPGSAGSSAAPAAAGAASINSIGLRGKGNAGPRADAGGAGNRGTPRSHGCCRARSTVHRLRGSFSSRPATTSQACESCSAAEEPVPRNAAHAARAAHAGVRVGDVRTSAGRAPAPPAAAANPLPSPPPESLTLERVPVSPRPVDTGSDIEVATAGCRAPRASGNEAAAATWSGGSQRIGAFRIRSSSSKRLIPSAPNAGEPCIHV